MSDYDWGSKNPFQKMFSLLLWMGFALGFGYVALAISTNHLITWADMSWHFFWAILKCLIIMALFPAIIFPVVFLMESKQTDTPPKHEFFSHSATVFTESGRSKYATFFACDIASMHLERIVFRDRPFFLVTVEFKPWNFPLLGCRGNERFGLPVKTEAELQPLRNWARENQIQISEQPFGEIQRRS